MAEATLIAVPEGTVNHSIPAYVCPGCGHGLRVSGLGRHRVYFELGGERSGNPVTNRVCPACGHGLPGKSPS
jgi:ribosomal protein S27AE